MLRRAVKIFIEFTLLCNLNQCMSVNFTIVHSFRKVNPENKFWLTRLRNNGESV